MTSIVLINLQGGQLFCTSIRTEPERKSVMLFLILNGFSCNKRQMPRCLLQKYVIKDIVRNSL